MAIVYSQADLSDLTKAALAELAREHAIPGRSVMNKGELIAAILNSQTDESPPTSSTKAVAKAPSNQVEEILHDIQVAFSAGARKAEIACSDSDVEKEVLSRLSLEERQRVVFGVSVGRSAVG